MKQNRFWVQSTLRFIVFTKDIENDITSNNNCYDNERVID